MRKKVWISIMGTCKKYEEVIRYLIIGGMATIISLSIKYILLFTILDAKIPVQLQTAVGFSWLAAVIFAYFANRNFVFKSENQNRKEEMTKFIGSRILTLVLEAGLMWFFVTYLQMNRDWQLILCTIIVQTLVMIGNYILSRLFVFKRKERK